MENIVLIINVVLAILLIGVILLQKSEGGALGIGVSQDSFVSSRSASSFLTKTTTILATLFIITSITLTVISREEVSNISVLEKIYLYFLINIQYNILPWRDMYLSQAAWFHL